MNDASEVTRRIARFIVDTRFETIPGSDVASAKLAMLDCLGCALAAHGEPGARIVTEYVRDLGGEPRCGVIACGFKTAAPLAALANGTLAHALDHDDVSPSGHASVILLPAILASAESRNRGGRDCLEAYVVGFEVAYRIAASLGLRGDHQIHGLHLTSVLGVMAATAAAAKLAGLDEEATRRALGIAASQASGVLGNLGFDVKPFHAGHASKSAMVSVELAERGLTAAPDVFERPVGYGEAVLGAGEPGRVDHERLLAGLGSDFHVAKGLSFKKYPCCYYVHRALDSVLGLMREHELDFDRIERVELELRRIPPFFHAAPGTGPQGKFNFEYCLASAILDGEVGHAAFEEGRVACEPLRRALDKVRVVRRPIWTVWRQGSNRVRLHTRDGRRLERDVRAPLGDAANPLPAAAVHEKFRRNASRALDEPDVASVLEEMLALEKLDRIDAIMERVTFVSPRPA